MPHFMYWATSYFNVYICLSSVYTVFVIPIYKPVVILSLLIKMYFYVSYLLASIQCSHTFCSTANLTYTCLILLFTLV